MTIVYLLPGRQINGVEIGGFVVPNVLPVVVTYGNLNDMRQPDGTFTFSTADNPNLEQCHFGTLDDMEAFVNRCKVYALPGGMYTPFTILSRMKKDLEYGFGRTSFKLDRWAKLQEKVGL